MSTGGHVTAGICLTVLHVDTFELLLGSQSCMLNLILKYLILAVSMFFHI